MKPQVNLAHEVSVLQLSVWCLLLFIAIFVTFIDGTRARE